jgi:hypothetical protein
VRRRPGVSVSLGWDAGIRPLYAELESVQQTNEKENFVSGIHLIVMLTKNDFSSTDWHTLRDAPYLVGLATLVAGSSGLGSVRESMAIARGIIEGQSSDVALVRDLTNHTEMQEAQSSMRDRLGGLDASVSKDRLKSLALERAAAAISIIDAKGSPEEASAVRQWLYSIAERVAKAAKEGGFLGFGGTQVSEDEQAFLNDLRAALQIQVGRA